MSNIRNQNFMAFLDGAMTDYRHTALVQSSGKDHRRTSYPELIDLSHGFSARFERIFPNRSRIGLFARYRPDVN